MCLTLRASLAACYACVPCSDEVNAVAKRLHLKLFRTSVKEKFNVEEGMWPAGLVMYPHLCSQCIQQLEYLSHSLPLLSYSLPPPPPHFLPPVLPSSPFLLSLPPLLPFFCSPPLPSPPPLISFPPPLPSPLPSSPFLLPSPPPSPPIQCSLIYPSGFWRGRQGGGKRSLGELQCSLHERCTSVSATNSCTADSMQHLYRCREDSLMSHDCHVTILQVKLAHAYILFTLHIPVKLCIPQYIIALFQTFRVFR